MKPRAEPERIQRVIDKVEDLGFQPHPIYGVINTVIAVIGDRTQEAMDVLQAMPDVDRVVPILRPYKLAGREVCPENTIVHVGDVAIGAEAVCIIAGPCAVESQEQYLSVGRYVKEAGAHILRGSIYKPRTSPHSFQGLQDEGIEFLELAHQELRMPIVTEVLDPRHIERLEPVTDIFQIGARNMQNFALLAEVGRTNKPVLVKRGMSATIDDMLKAAEYVLVGGNTQVVLCERGIRTFETQTRNTLDISAVPVVKRYSHLPLIVDPSHASGEAWMVPALSKAALAAGADGLMIETHPSPQNALVDGPQSLRPDDFRQLLEDLKPFASVAGRTM
jgi:3-deoxy-7-phosphoheptulonate synthase